MPITQESLVGLSSNPDDRPDNGSTTLTDSSKWLDPNNRNITFNVSGRLVRVYPRNVNPYDRQAST